MGRMPLPLFHPMEEGWGEEALFSRLPLSPALSPLVPRGERERESQNEPHVGCYRMKPYTMRAVVRSRDFVQFHQIALLTLANGNGLDFRGEDAAAFDQDASNPIRAEDWWGNASAARRKDCSR